MSTYTNIYVDMDGVLVNFIEGIFRAFEKKYDYASLPRPYKQDFWLDWGVSFLEADSVCTKDFWAGLRWMHDGKKILDIIGCAFYPLITAHDPDKEYVPGNKIFLLSTPMSNPGSWTGKRLWVENHVPQYKKGLIVTQADKSIFANGNSLLIDDKDENVESFIKAGGNAILVPRPWNKKYNCITIDYVRKELDKYRYYNWA